GRFTPSLSAGRFNPSLSDRVALTGLTRLREARCADSLWTNDVCRTGVCWFGSSDIYLALADIIIFALTISPRIACCCLSASPGRRAASLLGCVPVVAASLLRCYAASLCPCVVARAGDAVRREMAMWAGPSSQDG
ncbi:uncharacterized protein LOC112460508, partial [Temnothorax curvispinosus]|uniref:Uncharacterized protein LOC112460508 n=1 Tax=Temnothorax curvispinosus TaxID=300111 RepID=A0A6J1QK84_9HYME